MSKEKLKEETTLHNDKVNLASRLKEMRKNHGDRNAIVYSKGRDKGGIKYDRITYDQIDRMSDRIAYGLEDTGIKAGVKTIVMVKPGPGCMAIIFALFKVGAVPVVVDPGMGIGNMLHCYESTRAEAFIGIPIAHVLRVMKPKYFTTLKTWITQGNRYFWSGPRIKEFLDKPDKEYNSCNADKDELAAIFFTTGSTGPAKGVEYTHGMIEGVIRIAQQDLGFRPEGVDLATFLLFGLLAIISGATMVIPDMDPTKPAKVNPVKIISNIKDQKVTNMFASPALLDRVSQYGHEHNIKLPTLQRVLSGGAPVSGRIVEQLVSMLNRDTELIITYGATEALPISRIGSKEILNETGKLSASGYGTCVGRPFKGVDVKIIKITDDPIETWSLDILAEPKSIGEIIVRGDHVNKQYFESPDANIISKIKDGKEIWHRMGDLGWIDDKGRIWFCGRKKHRVITEKGMLFSVCLEQIFNSHPKVFRSALVGIGRKPMQKPVICIELKKEKKTKSKKIIKNELLRLAGKFEITKNIDTIIFHKSFPVDIRHNAKIFREKLIPQASKELAKRK